MHLVVKVPAAQTIHVAVAVPISYGAQEVFPEPTLHTLP